MGSALSLFKRTEEEPIFADPVPELILDPLPYPHYNDLAALLYVHEKLEFSRYGKSGFIAQMRIVNLKDEDVAFQVKSTDEESFTIYPHSTGLLKPHGGILINVVTKPELELAYVDVEKNIFKLSAIPVRVINFLNNNNLDLPMKDEQKALAQLFDSRNVGEAIYLDPMPSDPTLQEEPSKIEQKVKSLKESFYVKLNRWFCIPFHDLELDNEVFQMDFPEIYSNPAVYTPQEGHLAFIERRSLIKQDSQRIPFLDNARDYGVYKILFVIGLLASSGILALVWEKKLVFDAFLRQYNMPKWWNIFGWFCYFVGWW